MLASERSRSPAANAATADVVRGVDDRAAGRQGRGVAQGFLGALERAPVVAARPGDLREDCEYPEVARLSPSARANDERLVAELLRALARRRDEGR